MGDNPKKTKLGRILLKQGVLDEERLNALLRDQPSSGLRLASHALARGVADEHQLLKALSEQQGVPAANLDEVEITLKDLSFIPLDIARKHLILPISVAGDTIHLAMATPEESRVIEEIEFVSGKRVFPYVALQSQLKQAIEQCYSSMAAGQKLYRGKNAGRPRPAPGPGRVARADASAVPGTVLADRPRAAEPEESDLDIEVEISFDQIVEIDSPSSGPAASAPAPTAKADPRRFKEEPKRRKVLVVDDEEDILTLISRVLSDRNYEVITASRGLEAIKKVQAENPDMIILDAMLPEVHGFDICKKIKGSSKYGHIPVIMISAIYRGWRYAQDLKDSYGVDDFIEKPFKIQQLIKMVERYSTGDPTKSASMAEELSKEAETTLTDGIKAYRAGQIDEAIEMIKRGIKIDPLAYRLHYHLALLLGKKGLNYQAIRALENTLELAPEYYPALKNLAVLYQKAGFKFKAVETWERALRHCDDESAREGIRRHLVSLL